MWKQLAEAVIAGLDLDQETALALLQSPDEETLPILDAAWRVRRHHFGNQVRANVLSNAKRGACSEDCHYCSQSRELAGREPAYPLLGSEELFEQARAAKDSGSQRFCITMAARSPGWKAVDVLATATRRIKAELGLEVCASLGLMTGPDGQDKLASLRLAGLDAYNHNLNTHHSLYPAICSTHRYEDRLETIRNARAAGLEVCSGLIVGMGESDAQLVDLALAFRAEGITSLPVNFLIPVPGAPLDGVASSAGLSPWRCLRILCLFRLALPRVEIRASAGREYHLRSLQALALLPANSLFLDGYLTQAGRQRHEDLAMIADLGMALGEFSMAGGS